MYILYVRKLFYSNNLGKIVYFIKNTTEYIRCDIKYEFDDFVNR